MEKTFNKIARNVFKRLPSTTGSDPKHGRAHDAEAAATTYKILADEAEQLTDVFFAEHNATPGERNFFRSPLETLRRYLSGDSPKSLVRTLPPDIAGKSRLEFRREIVTVRGAVKSGRRPYIQYENVRYTNPLLSDSHWLIGKQLSIYIDDNDLRQVRAFLPSGQEYGILVASKRWGVTKHNLTTRKAIYSLVYKKVLVLSEIADPVFAYIDYLGGKIEKRRGNHASNKKEAVEAARVANDAGVNPRIDGNGGARQFSFRAEPMSASPKVSVIRPLPADFFTVRNRVKNG